MNHKVVVISLATFVFSLGFYSNFWGTVDQYRFENFDSWCKSQVVGRIIKAEKEGVFSDGGFNGWVMDGPKEKLKRPERHYYQFEIYENELDVDVSKFAAYESQMGGQAMFFALCDKVSPFNNSKNLKLFFLLTSVSLAFILSLFVFWVFNFFGRFPAFITTILIIISPWLTIYGNGIYWVLSVFYLPFVIFLWSFHKETTKKIEISLWRLFFLALVLAFIKLLFTGFEFITTALVMLTIPTFYYAFLNKWKFGFFLKRFITISSGAVSAIVLYFIAFAFQLSASKGGFFGGMKHILFNFSKRTYGNSDNLPEMYKESLETSIPEVLDIYWNSTAIDLNAWFKNGMKGVLTINFGDLFLFFLIFSALCFISKGVSPTTYRNRKKNTALVFVTWISMLAPLSWFVIFKSHSEIHFRYNSIVWYMPFCLLGFALVGSVFSSLVFDAYARFKAKKSVLLRIAAISIIVLLSCILCINISNGIRVYKNFQHVTNTENLLHEMNGFEIYLHDNKLWYINRIPSDQDRDTRFFVHIVPTSIEDLPEERKIHKYDNLDFNVDKRHILSLPVLSRKGGYFIAYTPLKDYQISKIRTGQYIKRNIIWDTGYLPLDE